jgi:hypothetical protein
MNEKLAISLIVINIFLFEILYLWSDTFNLYRF